MGAVDTTNTFTATDVITSTKMNNIIDQTVMTSDAITLNGTLQVVAPGKLQVAAGGITSAQLANDAVTTVAITDANVTPAKLANADFGDFTVASGVATLDNNVVTTAKILDANVTTAKIADANVTAAKLDGAQTGTAPIFGARAWVNFNGTGTVAINASGNVSSITDLGIGHYQIDFTTAMQDVNYVTVGTTNNDAGDSSRPVIVIPITNTTSSVTIKTLGTFNNNAAIDCSQIFLAVFR